jgi:hypothetical protein
MVDDAPKGAPKLTLGQAIDQVIAALGIFQAADQQTILRAAYAHLNISGPVGGAMPPVKRQEDITKDERASEPPPRTTEGEFSGMDIKTFKELKGPSSARQMACVVAYILRRSL